MSSIKTLIDAYIKRNANQEITGPVLNGVLTAIADALGTPFIGEDGYWYTYDPETGQFVQTDTPAQGESGVVAAYAAVGVSPDPQPLPSVNVIYDATLRQLDFTFYDIQGPKGDQGTPGITGASVSVDANVGTPSVDASIVNSILTLAFHNLRGAAAGFGTPTISVGANQGTPSASVTASGPDTAKVFAFAFDGLKGETGPQGPQGPQGNPGSSQDYPFTLANNLTTDDSTVALTAAMGVQLEGEVSQLSQEVDNKLSSLAFDYTQIDHTVQSGTVNPNGSLTTSSSWERFIIPNKGYFRIKVKAYTSPSFMAIAFYNSETLGVNTFMGQDSVVGRNYTNNYDVPVPAGCVTIVVCNRVASLPTAEITVFATDISSYIKEIGTNKSLISNLSMALSLENADIKKENVLIYYPSGGLGTGDGRNTYLFKNYGFTQVEAYLGADSSSFAAIAFYSGDYPSEDGLISAIQTNSSEATNYQAVVPSGCKLIAIASKETSVTPSATIYLSKTQSVFDKMDERYNELKEKIGDETGVVSLNDPLRMPHILQQLKFTGAVGIPATAKPIVLLHFSDIHGGNYESRYLINKTTLQRVIDFKTEYADYIDDIICTGDQCFQDIPDRQDYDGNTNWWDSVEGSNKILPVLGNHDTFASGSVVNGSAGLAVSYSALFNHIADCNPTSHPDGKCYYYKDYTTQNIRLIVVDPYYSDSDEEQWFSQALSNAREGGLSVIIAIHPPFNSYTPLDCTFNSLRFDGSFTQHVQTENYISMVDTFIAEGGELICWLTGHVHGDVVGYLGTTRKQLAIGAPSAKAPRSAQTASESNNVDMRILGTKSQDSFNIFGCNTIFKTLTIMRIGSDYDIALRHRGRCVIKYDTMEVLFND